MKNGPVRDSLVAASSFCSDSLAMPIELELAAGRRYSPPMGWFSHVV